MPSLNLGDLEAMMPLAGLLGIELVEADREQATARMAWEEERCTVGGILHGGALMALADTAAAVCAFLNLPDGAVATSTIESKTNFVRAVSGGAVTACTRPLHRGRTLAVLETEVTDDDDGRLVAKTSQTQIFKYPDAS